MNCDMVKTNKGYNYENIYEILYKDIRSRYGEDTLGGKIVAVNMI